MTPLFTAIYNHFVGSALATQISNRLFLNEAPQGTDFPYAVYQILPSITDYTLCPAGPHAMNFDECSIQFSLYSEVLISASEVGTMFSNLTALYDWAVLVVAGYTSHYMRRDSFHLDRDIDNNVWQYVVSYTALLESG